MKVISAAESSSASAGTPLMMTGTNSRLLWNWRGAAPNTEDAVSAIDARIENLSGRRMRCPWFGSDQMSDANSGSSASRRTALAASLPRSVKSSKSNPGRRLHPASA
jgi:hypothetical protein